MQPVMWTPPIELSQQEEQMVRKIRKANLFVFLRKLRHALFDAVVHNLHVLARSQQLSAELQEAA